MLRRAEAINERSALDDFHEGVFLLFKPPLNKLPFIDSEISLQKPSVSVDVLPVRKYQRLLHF